MQTHRLRAHGRHLPVLLAMMLLVVLWLLLVLRLVLVVRRLRKRPRAERRAASGHRCRGSAVGLLVVRRGRR